MVKCRGCSFRAEDYLTSFQGQGLYRFSYCGRLPHDTKMVEPDVDRECEHYRKRLVIAVVYRFENNMVMVFDPGGEQMPEYQGQFTEVKDRINDDAPLDAEFFLGQWGQLTRTFQGVTREQWFEVSDDRKQPTGF